jgi:hypothetical protein
MENLAGRKMELAIKLKNIFLKFRLVLVPFFLFSFLHGGLDLEDKRQKNQNIIKDSYLGIDKVQHIMYSLFVTLGTQYILVNKNKMIEHNALPLSMITSSIAGLLKEIQDKKSKKNYFSKKDMVANSLGILLASLIVY